MKSIILLFSFLSFLAFWSCSVSPTSASGTNDRDKLGLNGPVKKVETISITTTPLGEMVVFYPSEKNKVQCVDGDVTVTFTEDGQISEYTIYGQENEELYVAVKAKDSIAITPICCCEPTTHQVISQTSTVCHYDSIDRPLSIVYNKNGSQYRKIEFKYFGTTGGNERITHYSSYITDTMRFVPTKFDEQGNWIEGEKTYIGFFPNHNDRYIIHRQISYYGKEEKVMPLILQYNKRTILQRSNQMFSWRRENCGNTIRMNIPNCYVKDNSLSVQNAIDSINKEFEEYGLNARNAFQYTYSKNDAFSIINVSVSNRPDEAFYMSYDFLPEERLTYDEETNLFFQASIIEMLHSEGKELLIWRPYRFMKLGNHIALETHFYRWDESPFPMEIYRYHIPLPNGKDIHLSFLWLSNHTAQFEPLKDKIIESIQFL